MKIVLVALSCVWLFPDSNNAQSCQSPALSQGFLVPQKDVYQHGSTAYYSCNPGLKPALQTWWGELKCENGEWSHTAQCIAVSDCLPPEVPNAKPVQPLQTSYSSNSRINFSCNKGYEFEDVELQEAVCTHGEWKLPLCKQKLTACGVPTSVANAVITQSSQNVFEHTDRVEYQCKNGYKMDGQKYSYCMFGVWTPAPKCVSENVQTPTSPSQPAGADNTQWPPAISHVRTCGTYPAIENGDVIEQDGGRVLQVQCVALYELEGPDKVMCVFGQWSQLPVCKAPCRLDQSKLLQRQREYLKHREEDSFWCHRGGWLHIKCINGRAYYRGCGLDE